MFVLEKGTHSFLTVLPSSSKEIRCFVLFHLYESILRPLITLLRNEYCNESWWNLSSENIEVPWITLIASYAKFECLKPVVETVTLTSLHFFRFPKRIKEKKRGVQTLGAHKEKKKLTHLDHHFLRHSLYCCHLSLCWDCLYRLRCRINAMKVEIYSHLSLSVSLSIRLSVSMSYLSLHISTERFIEGRL